MSSNTRSPKVIFHIYAHTVFSDTKREKKNKLQPTSEDRWPPTSGSRPGSDDVGSDYNLLCSRLPTAVQDNMFHPLREHTEAGSSAVPSLLKRCRDCKSTLAHDALSGFSYRDHNMFGSQSFKARNIYFLWTFELGLNDEWLEKQEN